MVNFTMEIPTLSLRLTKKKNLRYVLFVELMIMLNILTCDDFTLGQQSFLHSM